ncbi:MAG: maltose ABC transporter substrate-binding protein [Actinobacteria bacterium]|jgi:maltose-binding protein MalE|nr:maltose ABC transporter substrate-binding protein [Actinomycetota bacterium]MDA9607867.1 extracellular solute-binding protein [Candidatus Actinomarina sp.]MDG1201630.1 extracellular solute-binding protein [Candidatus Actinomarina sp.]MDG1228536.1 extracellular solute-binding protein [Candidatus Actinomarina sp.]MDG1740529.1 extracellular solute-binding protein [Candidatus Actinomarina sp.]|tara:strand:+ start:1569 stop:2858 length:1290 start_codon:yes stop_codon:yes gene_type:complete
MKRNKLRYLVILVLLSLVVTACGGDSDTASDSPEATEAPIETLAAPATTSPPPVKLVVWAEEKVATALDPLVGAYEAAAGVDIEVVVYDFGAIRTDVQTAGPAGEGPDVFLGAHDWVGELAANGVVAPLDLGSVASDLFEVGVTAFSYGGEVYGFPYATEAIAMFYNADLVDSVPATWEEAKTACDTAGTEFCVGTPSNDAYHNHPFIASAGGYVFASTGGFDASDVGLDNAGAIASAEYLDGLVKNGTVYSADYGGAMSNFQEGRALFWMTGPWARGDASAVNYGVGLIPQFDGNAATPFVGVRGAMVSSFSDNQVLAQSFILDFFATIDVQQAMYESDPRLPATKSLFAVVEAADPIAASFAASASNGIPMPNIPEMGSVWGPMADALNVIREQAYGTNEETGVTINNATDAVKLAAEQVRNAIAGG